MLVAAGCGSSPAAANGVGSGASTSGAGTSGNTGGSDGSSGGNGGVAGTGARPGTGGRTGTGGGGPGAGGPAYGERSAANILFSGHSLMDNPITDWTVAIAQSRGDTIGWEQQIINGSPLAMRTKGDGSHPGTPPWNGYSHGSAKNRDGVQGSLNVLTELATPSRLPQGQTYDTLLVTERHDPLNTVQWENTIGYLRHYHDRLAEHSDTSRTLLYQVWPDIDKGNPQPWLDYARVELVVWECIAEKANLSLEAEGRTRSVAVIPGSVILARFVEEVLDGTIPGVSGLNDVFTDNVHLTAAGQYLIAATFYAAAYGKSPVGAKAATGLSESTMEAIEQLAWGEVSTYFESGYPEGRPLSECRTYVAEEVCPAHYSIRGQQTPNCSYWSSGDSPLNFPDDDFLYPAP